MNHQSQRDGDRQAVDEVVQKANWQPEHDRRPLPQPEIEMQGVEKEEDEKDDHRPLQEAVLSAA